MLFFITREVSHLFLEGIFVKIQGFDEKEALTNKKETYVKGHLGHFNLGKKSPVSIPMESADSRTFHQTHFNINEPNCFVQSNTTRTNLTKKQELISICPRIWLVRHVMRGSCISGNNNVTVHASFDCS